MNYKKYVILRAQWGFHPGGWGKPPVDEVKFYRINLFTFH